MNDHLEASNISYSSKNGSSDINYGSNAAKNTQSINEATACRRCRTQKSRCSRELPSCKRCLRNSAVCVYPPPPERKILAARRMKAKARALSVPSVSISTGILQLPSISSPREFENARQSPEHQARIPLAGHSILVEPPSLLQATSSAQPTPFPAWVRPTNGDLALPSPEIGMLLIDIYFQRVYNASLLFHKVTFVSDYIHHKLPDHVYLSVFALASVYLRDGRHLPHLQESCAELGVTVSSVMECASRGYQYATIATQMFLIEADQPSIESIQTCQNLGLFWMSIGQWRRTHMHAHMAYRMCRLLGFHAHNDHEAEADCLLAEIKRRCFWAAWITNCLSQGNATFRSQSWREAVGLPLPSDEASFSAGKPESREVYSANGDLALVDAASGKTARPSIFGEIVKLFSLWWDIHHFVRRYETKSPEDSLQRISDLLALDRRLEQFYENLHSDFRYRGQFSSTAPKIDPYRLFWLHVLYNLCAYILHSTNIPVFSGIAPDCRIPKKLVRLSAEEAVKHFTAIIDMATALSEIQPDVTRLPAIVGYAMFAASWAQYKSLEAQDQLQSQGLVRCKAAITLLDQLKQYWRPLAEMWRTLDSVFRSGDISLPNLGSSQPTCAATMNVDQIATHIPTAASSPNMYTYIQEHESRLTSHNNPPKSKLQIDDGRISGSRPLISQKESTAQRPIGNADISELGSQVDNSRQTDSFHDPNSSKQQYKPRYPIYLNPQSGSEESQLWWDQCSNGVSLADPFRFFAEDLIQVGVGW